MARARSHRAYPSPPVLPLLSRRVALVIYPDLPLIFSREARKPIFSQQGAEFWSLILHNCIIIFKAERVYLNPQVTNVKNNVTANPKLA